MSTAPNTTKLGITVFDQAFGGIYLHKPTILCGRRKSGKFVVATQLMVKTLRVGDRVVLFTAKNAEEVIRAVPTDTLNLEEAVESRQLLICPYSSMERSGTGPYAPLPFPQALDELSKLVKANGVTYAIFDSIVPWTAVQPLEGMQEHVDTFFSTLDGLGLTSLLLLPEPASAAALSLATVLREVCPINIEISSKNFGAEFTMQVTKYQGLQGAARKLPQKFALDLTPGVGFDSPDAPKAKTLSDLEAFASSNHAAAAHGRNASPAFRPFLAGGLATFAGDGAAAAGATSPGEPKPDGHKAAAVSQQPAASGQKPQAETQKQTAELEMRPSANAAASGAEDGFSFASVIDMPEFQHDGQPAARPEPTNQPPPIDSGIQFSSVIR
jgi:archaellum biogenesis ATPase FlaH